MPVSTLDHTTPLSAVSRRPLVVGSHHLVHRGATARRATILDVRTTKKGSQEAYISFQGADKRLDTWVSEDEIRVQLDINLEPPRSNGLDSLEPSPILHRDVSNIGIPKNGESSKRPIRPEPSPSAPSTPEREHATMTRMRNFEDVRFGEYLIKTWYYSPYPIPVEDKPEMATLNGLSSSSMSKKRKLESTPNDHIGPKQTMTERTLTTTVTGQQQRSTSTRSAGEMFAGGVGKGGEGARGRLWVCDLCFKYMRTRDGWERHITICGMMQPPGRKVYQRGSYTIWEVDGALASLYCQNLSLFGKFFIDHKSVFFHVENFIFYVICDAATSRRDQVMAFFSKEKLSYDDYNLACIVTFPPCQNKGFGKLLIEFSYYLTKNPSTRPTNLSPGTPERPLSDLGLKGYTAYWISTVLRVCRALLADAPPIDVTPKKPIAVSSPSNPRALRERHKTINGKIERVQINGVDMNKLREVSHRGQYAISCSLFDLARAAHLRVDDTAFTLAELGFLQHRRQATCLHLPLTSNDHNDTETTLDGHGYERHEEDERGEDEEEHDLGEWKDVEVVITRSMVDDAWKRWKVRDKGVLEEECVLL